ncbi:unnamed protein product [Paramecium primaurelia]|uniref:Uncharacterized protein n=1 Tax=Paramecium primaurelia TaxID=5886 RepID=A0A8S1NJJ3_PARPR|nr:unnamed protein product [Paramecium primaurelia]
MPQQQQKNLDENPEQYQNSQQTQQKIYLKILLVVGINKSHNFANKTYFKNQIKFNSNQIRLIQMDNQEKLDKDFSQRQQNINIITSCWKFGLFNISLNTYLTNSLIITNSL